MQHIAMQTRKQIREALGFDFVFISFSTFEPFEGVKRTSFTVRRPKGTKFYHLIRYENGSILS